MSVSSVRVRAQVRAPAPEPAPAFALALAPTPAPAPACGRARVHAHFCVPMCVSVFLILRICMLTCKRGFAYLTMKSKSCTGVCVSIKV